MTHNHSPTEEQIVTSFLELLDASEGVQGVHIDYDGCAALATAIRNWRNLEPTPNVDVISEIAAERRRQIEAERWAPEHDDAHADGGYDNEPPLPQAAACYAIGRPFRWPWDEEWWKPSDHRRNCVKAAALLVAEIERLDRAALNQQKASR